jgi:endonuclease-3
MTAQKSASPPKSKRGRESKRALRARVEQIIALLRTTYPDAECALLYRNAWELLVSTILSAQCTDKRVNMVTPALFARFPSVEAFAAASREDLETAIRSTGFFRNKAKNIQGAAHVMLEKFGGAVPKTMAELLELPGVARKTANVVLGVAFQVADGIVVDTHVSRLSQRLKLTREKDPTKIERDLMQVVPQADWIDIGHLLIHHGRALCTARKPACSECPLQDLCPSAAIYLNP